MYKHIWLCRGHLPVHALLVFLYPGSQTQVSVLSIWKQSANTPHVRFLSQLGNPKKIKYIYILLLSCEDLITAVPNRFISPQFFKLLMQISLHYYNSITLPIRLKQCTLFWKEQYHKESIAHHQSSSHFLFRWPSKQEEANSKEAQNNMKTKLAWLFFSTMLLQISLLP